MCQAEKGPELTAPAAPEASEPETELLAEAKAAGLFLDRELSWLQFNRRVLEQAGDPTVPLLERLKFLGIYRSNLEEFFMVRVGSLTHRAALLPDERDEKTGRTPGEQVSAILAAVAAQQPREERIYRRLLEDMRDAGIDVLDFHKMTKPEEVVAKKYFSELRPLLSPRVVDGGHPFPFIANREIYVAATIGKGDYLYIAAKAEQGGAHGGARAPLCAAAFQKAGGARRCPIAGHAQCRRVHRR